MHFIGNRSIALADGQSRLQLVYSPEYTGFSCVLPVIGLTIAFQSAEISIHSFVWRRLLDVVCGLMAGLSIVSMHYLASLLKMDQRLVEALSLRAAACGRSLKRIPPEAAPDARNTPVIVAATMCFVAALSCLLILFYVRYRNAVLANRAQHMMLACPAPTSTNMAISWLRTKGLCLHKGLLNDLCFKNLMTTLGYTILSGFGFGKMRVHLQRTNVNTGYNTAASSRSSIYDEESYHDSTVLFREGYCVAAADLAAQLQVPLVDGLGPLYDQVLGTGLLTAYQHGLKALDNGATQQLTIFEKGQLLFYTRRLSPHEIDHYTAAGFRFAPLNRVEGAIANTMQIPIGLLAIQMQRVQDFAYRTSVPCPPKQGTFFVCLAALARVRDSFRVLVPMDRQDELPDVQVSPYHMNSQQLSWLKRYNNWPAERFIWHIKLKEQNWSTLEDDEEKAFLIMLRTALGSLVTKIGERWFTDLVFCAEPITIRYGANKAQRDGMTMVFGFTRLMDIHQPARKLPAGLTLASWDLVRMRQHYYRGCNDQGRMRREVQEEFGPLLAKHEEAIRSEGQRVKSHKLDRTRSPCSDDSGVLKEDYWLEGRHADVRRGSIDSIVGHPHSWGGILATTDTVIEGVSKSTIELRNLTPQVTAGASAMVIAKEPKTWFLKGTVWVSTMPSMLGCDFLIYKQQFPGTYLRQRTFYIPCNVCSIYGGRLVLDTREIEITTGSYSYLDCLKTRYRLTLVAQRKRSSTSYDVFAMVLLYVCERSHFRVAVVQLRYRMVMKRQKVDDKYTTGRVRQQSQRKGVNQDRCEACRGAHSESTVSLQAMISSSASKQFL
ncbi:hypothetical protein KCU99_g6, partial [Aureobasidium melanogenum]